MESREEIMYRIKSLTERQFGISTTMITSSYLLFLVVSIQCVPEMIDTNSMTVSNCYSESECFALEDGKAVWRGYLNGIVLENQVLALRMVPHSREKLAFSSSVSLTVVGANSEIAAEEDEIGTNAKDCNIECDSGVCEECHLFYLPIIKHSSYIAKVTFLSSVPEEITSIEFEWSFIRDEFIVYQLRIKYFLFSLSLVSLVVYFYSLRTVSFRNWSLQSKLTGLLSVSLVFFNEPLFAMNIYRPSETTLMVSALCISQGLSIVFGIMLVSFQVDIGGFRGAWLYAVEGIVFSVFFVLMNSFVAGLYLHNKYGLNYEWSEIYSNNYMWTYYAFILLAGAIFLLIAITVSISNELDKKAINKIKICFTLWIIKSIITLEEGNPTSPKALGSSIFVITTMNFFVLNLAFFAAPTRVSIVNFQNFNQLGQEPKKNPRCMAYPDITEKKNN